MGLLGNRIEASSPLVSTTDRILGEGTPHPEPGRQLTSIQFMFWTALAW